LNQTAHRGRLYVRDIERAGERRQAIAAVGIRRFLKVIADELQLGVARARVDEIVEQLREGAHCALECVKRRPVPSAGERPAPRGSPCCRSVSGCRVLPRHVRGRIASRRDGQAGAQTGLSGERGSRARQAHARRPAGGWRPFACEDRAARAWDQRRESRQCGKPPASLRALVRRSPSLSPVRQRSSRILVKAPLRSRVGCQNRLAESFAPRLGGGLPLFFFQVGTDPMAKPATVKIKLVSTADTGFFYVTKKNPRTQTEKLSFKKYDPKARKHVEFKESKIK